MVALFASVGNSSQHAMNKKFQEIALPWT